MPLNLADINVAERDRFVRTLGGVFEDSPWIAAAAWDSRPFADVDALHAAMIAVVDRAGGEPQLALLRAHPDLGTRARMSDASIGEQAGAGLDRLTSAEFERLQSLNAAYRGRFGFPFLYAVRGSTKHDIINALEARLTGQAADELREALQQVYRIARFRLDDLFGT